jgi:hypothetical protein
MDLTPLPYLLEQLASWRYCVAAAEQDVRDAEDAAILADVKLGKARQAQQWAVCEAKRCEAKLAGLVVELTEPPADLFRSDG